MIRKELFKKCMTNLKKYKDWEHELYKVGIDFWEREELQDMITAFVELLEYTCKDDEECSDIDYFMCECDWGNKADDYFITESDGTEVKFHTIDDLWEYLIKCHPEIDDKSIKKEQKAVNLSQEELTEIFMENFTK